MNVEAVFIGGSFDMTKRMLEREFPYVDFMEPLNLEYKTVDMNEMPDSVECKVVRYEICFKTRHGVLIYECIGRRK